MGTELNQNRIYKSNRFSVSTVANDNPIAVTDDINNARRPSRLSLQGFFQTIIPDDGSEVPARKDSKCSALSSVFFKDPDRVVMDFSQEAAPRLENYRNSLTLNNYITRPSLDQLHQEQEEYYPSLTEGKGEGAGAIKFGWIRGVYIRCVVNIFGVVLFLRMGWMTGQCGIVLAVVIVFISTVVTIITTLSMSAICTNGHVRGGGAYYLISRSLGPECGGLIGVVLFLAYSVAAAMYIVGAGEAVQDILQDYHTGIVEVPSGINDIRVSGVIILVLLMTVTGVGMAFENKTQMLLLVLLITAIMDYMVGASLQPTDEEKARGFFSWNLTVAQSNLGPDFKYGETFFTVFSVFFPAVHGIYAGASISGDLKDPCSAIPKGTLLAIITTSATYAVIVVWLGFTVLREATGNYADIFNGTLGNCENVTCDYGLINDYEIIKFCAAAPSIIYVGLFAATLSSALIAIISAPKILQALCIDGVVPWLSWFGKGYGVDNEPRRGLALTFIIALGFIGIGDLNVIAPYISNFFMAANGLINFACFHASYIGSPGFRPGFKYYNLWLSLAGALISVVIMFIMNWVIALATVVTILALYVYISKTCPGINWGSSFQGYVYKNALYYLNKLNKIDDHVKLYRPAILVLTGNASSRPQLVDFAQHLTKDHGLLICGHVTKMHEDWNRRRKLSHLNYRWLNQRNAKSFYSSVEADSLCKGVSSLIQADGLGKMKPNIVLLGFKQNWSTCDNKELLDYFDTIHEILDAQQSLCILKLPGGADYSKYLDTPDGMPFVCEKDTGISKETRNSKNITDIPKTGFEETYRSRSSEPTLVVGDTEIHLSVSSVFEAMDQDDKCDKSEKHEMTTPPNHIMEMINMYKTKQKGGTIDVWWLYDTGGLTILLPYILTTRSKFKDCKLRVFSVAQDDRIISDEQLNLASLLQEFRIHFSDLTVLSLIGEPHSKQSEQRLEELMANWITDDEEKLESGFITRNNFNGYKRKTNQYLRLRDLLEKYSQDANLIVLTLPIPRKKKCPASLYMAWLDILTHDMPPCLLVRGNQTSVLTFYS